MLRRLRLTSFRCHSALDLENLGSRVLLVGANGRGKTTVLEAASLLGRLRSFRTRTLRDLTRHGAEGWRIEGSWADEAGPVRLGAIWRGQGRELEIDGRAGVSTEEFWGRALVVVAQGGDFSIFEGSSAERRAGFDLLLAEVDPEQLPTLRRLKEVARQRAALLRHLHPSRQEWEAWTQQLAELGQILRPAREALAQKFLPHLELAHRELTAGAEKLKVTYQPETGLPSEGPERDALWSRERERGLNLVGPQRDDWDFSLGGRSLSRFGSEGQRRSACLAVRLAELQLIRETRKRTPILLVDDALKELDEKRREAFWRQVPAQVQVLYASAHDRPHEGRDSWVILQISPGSARPGPE
ncbi:MAG: DNA replication and repair protein RecF [Verrucomicrobia bacterium]|nr:DNA replication and repair protein RecF [Verrucomicrobiota bacterium]